MPKYCPRCKEAKALDAFTTPKASYCRPCMKFYMEHRRPGRKLRKLRENVINVEFRRGEFADKLAAKWLRVKVSGARFRHV